MDILFVTNLLTPYRVAFFDRLYANLKEGDSLHVLAMTDRLPLRPWSYDDLKRPYTILLPGRTVYWRSHDFVFNRDLRKTVKEINPDIAVLAGSWTYPTDIRLAIFRKRYFRKDTKLLFWAESHDNAAKSFRAKSLDHSAVTSLKTAFLKKFDGFCVPGDLAEKSIRKFLPDAMFLRLRNAVDGPFYAEANTLRLRKTTLIQRVGIRETSSETLRQKYGIPETSKAILIPAKLIKLKGIYELFTGISPETAASYDFIFVLAGIGDQKERIEYAAARNGIRTLFLGYQSQENIRELLAACDFYCLPSLTDANPLSAIEAAWAGLPLLMSKYAGNHPELIQEDVNGTVFDPEDPDSVDSMMRRMLTKSPEWLAAASAASLSTATEAFDADVIARSLLSQFEQL